MKRSVNARVIECGQPLKAVYMGTYTDGSKHYVEVRYGNRQTRKWIKSDKVMLDLGVQLRYCEKVTELG